MTGEIKEIIAEKQREITPAVQTTDTQLAQVTETLKTLNTLDDARREVDMVRQLQEEQSALTLSRKLLDELVAKLQEDSVSRASGEKQDYSAQVTFGSQNSGLQIGVSHGPISGITFGGK